MANPEHLAVLKDGVSAWNAWRESNPEIRPDLRQADLQACQLGGASLYQADLAAIDFSGADLRGASLFKSNLQGARLFRSNLSSADLGKADLSSAALDGAVLDHADLRFAALVDAELARATCEEASFTAADLRGSDLREARFFQTDFSRANLQYTNLHRTQFFKALVEGADFSGAVFSETGLQGIDLRRAVGLEVAQHLASSSVGIDTLYRSAGAIPAVFLRGAGVPDDFIQYVQDHFGRQLEYYSAFISYSHSDRPFAQRLHDQLQARGIRCWRDEKEIKVGDRIFDAVSQAIRLHDKILLCCSAAALGSWWFKDELAKALEREEKENRLVLVPLNLDGSLFQWPGHAASDLTSRLAADFTGWEKDNAKFEKQFERVVAALRADGEA